MNYIQEFHKEKLAGWKSTVLTALKATATLVHSGDGKFGGYFIYNPEGAATYLQVYAAATAGAVTVGTTPPIARYALPAGVGANLELDRGLYAASGIVVAATTTPTGSGAPATGLDATIYWS